MMVKVAINGFGRIGRNILRAIIESARTDIEVIAINDLGSVENNAHLLKYDSVHGRFPAVVTFGDDHIDVGKGPIRVTAMHRPADLQWSDVDVVLECTGIFTSKAECQAYLDNGSSRVLISAPGKDTDKTIVYGVNHNTLTSNDLIVSNASCTTNCLAPIAKVLHENVGIKRGLMTTIHSYTGDQPTLDRTHSDLYRGRAAALSMIPTTTGAAKAVGLVLPELNGKLDGVAMRVPTPNVSAVDLTFEAGRHTDIAEITAMMQAAAVGPLKGVLDVIDEPLVSSDFNHDPHSSVFHADQTLIMGGDMVRVLSWYDNEWAFSNRMADTAVAMGELI
ncbi:MAG: type I glyceraldehyde-3-phosphate dehydrogenase [Planktomarina sp.]|nr:type I glyceraldehyde-3-phosphate dehydrogenase [Planktomarina sp.]